MILLRPSTAGRSSRRSSTLRRRRSRSQDRAEAKDYVDVARLLAEGISLREAVGAALAVYGPSFNPMPSLKALVYFGDGDLPSVPKATREALERAVRATPIESIRPLGVRGALVP